MIFKPSEKERALLFLDKMFEKKRHVKIEHITESKTLSQNAYLWLIFTHIAFETGNDKDDIYQYYLNKFPYFKEININGEINQVKITLSKFDLMQYKSFIDNITIDARSEGFDIPDPEDLKAVNMYNYYKQNGLI
jgi:hypothetical protein